MKNIFLSFAHMRVSLSIRLSIFIESCVFRCLGDIFLPWCDTVTPTFTRERYFHASKGCEITFWDLIIFFHFWLKLLLGTIFSLLSQRRHMWMWCLYNTIAHSNIVANYWFLHKTSSDYAPKHIPRGPYKCSLYFRFYPKSILPPSWSLPDYISWHQFLHCIICPYCTLVPIK